VLPGFAKLVVVKKPATKARKGSKQTIFKKGINPLTEELTVFQLMPARTKSASVVKKPKSSKVKSPVAPAEALSAESAYEPSARAQAFLRGKEICENDLRASGGSFRLEQVEKFLGVSRQAIDKKVRDDALLAIPGPHGRRRYPVVQFNADGVLPGLQSVLKRLPSANDWFRLNFLITPNSHLGGRRPIDLLKEGKAELVVGAAKAVGVQGA
jgi:hypothetical protein